MTTVADLGGALGAEAPPQIFNVFNTLTRKRQKTGFQRMPLYKQP